MLSNSSDMTYEPYGHQFYLHKDIGDVVFDGTEDWLIRTDVSQTNYTCFRNGSYVENSRYKASNITNLYCDYFVILAQYTSQAMIRIINSTGYGETILFPSSIASTVEGFKQWLSTHNTKVQYVLRTPTTEVISEENYPVLYKQLSDIQDYLTSYKINKEFILGYDEPSVEY